MSKSVHPLYYFCIAGLLFLFFYIQLAGYNIVYADYIRIVNRYLSTENIPSLSEMWAPSAGHRALGYFPFLYFNVRFLAFNTQFEMILGIVGVFLSSLVVVRFFLKQQLNFYSGLVALLLVFSLNKWELFLNGTGWTIFFAFACMYLNFYLVDAVFIDGKDSWNNKFLLYLLPILTIPGFAGGYSVAYTVTMVSFLCAIYTIAKTNKRFILTQLSLFIVLQAVYLYNLPVAVEKQNFLSVVGSNFSYLFYFYMASFASTIIGQETFFAGNYPEYWVRGVGIVVILNYYLALVLYFKNNLYKKTFFPLMMIQFSLLSHCIILYTRFGFNSISYSMSSRYQPMYLLGIIGMLSIFAYCRENRLLSVKFMGKNMAGLMAVFLVGTLVAGNVATTLDEIRKIPYRHSAYKAFETIALNYKNESDQSLQRLQSQGAEVRRALVTLEKRQLNLFFAQEGALPASIPTSLEKESNLILGRYYADGWISKEIAVRMNTGVNGKMTGKIFLPQEEFLPTGMTIFINNSRVFEQKIDVGGEKAFAAQYEPNQNVVVKIIMDKSLIPKEKGMGPDQRDISVILRSLAFE